MNLKRRKKVLVDSNVQGSIVARVLCYWAACLLFMTLPIILMMSLASPGVIWFDHLPVIVARFWPVFLVMFILLPFLIRDALMMSNRFCGPVIRMMRALKRYNETGEYEEIQFRGADFWQPMADALNAAILKKQETN